MNQKALQSGPDKSVDGFLDFFPVIAMIADHKLVDCQAAVHLEIEDGFRFLKGKNAAGHQPGDVMFFMVRHLVNDPCGDRIIQKQGAAPFDENGDPGQRLLQEGRTGGRKDCGTYEGTGYEAGKDGRDH